MRHAFTAAVAGMFILAPLTASAEDNDQVQAIPAVATASKQLICERVVHEGMMVSRPICLTAEAWANEKEQSRQQFRLYQKQNLFAHH